VLEWGIPSRTPMIFMMSFMSFFHDFPGFHGPRVFSGRIWSIEWDSDQPIATDPPGVAGNHRGPKNKQYPWRIHGAGVLILTWLGYIDGVHVTIYNSTMDPSWDIFWLKQLKQRLASLTHLYNFIHIVSNLVHGNIKVINPDTNHTYPASHMVASPLVPKWGPAVSNCNGLCKHIPISFGIHLSTVWFCSTGNLYVLMALSFSKKKDQSLGQTKTMDHTYGICLGHLNGCWSSYGDGTKISGCDTYKEKLPLISWFMFIRNADIMIYIYICTINPNYNNSCVAKLPISWGAYHIYHVGLYLTLHKASIPPCPWRSHCHCQLHLTSAKNRVPALDLN
jgi:hypothetical protein